MVVGTGSAERAITSNAVPTAYGITVMLGSSEDKPNQDRTDNCVKIGFHQLLL